MAESAVPAMVYAIRDYDDCPVLGKVFRRREDAEAVLAVMQADGKYESAVVEEYEVLEEIQLHQVIHYLHVAQSSEILVDLRIVIWPWEQHVPVPPQKHRYSNGFYYESYVSAESFVSREDAIRQAMEFWGRQNGRD